MRGDNYSRAFPDSEPSEMGVLEDAHVNGHCGHINLGAMWHNGTPNARIYVDGKSGNVRNTRTAYVYLSPDGVRSMHKWLGEWIARDDAKWKDESGDNILMRGIL